MYFKISLNVNLLLTQSPDPKKFCDLKAGRDQSSWNCSKKYV